MSTKFDCPILM